MGAPRPIKTALADDILKVSPVAWNHLNFRGRNQFRSQQKAIDIDAIVQKLAQIKVFLDLRQTA